MNKRQWFRKTVAWSLIAAMANPAAIAPAFARDTDIFLTVASGTASAEPNILIVLDTSDSMNIPEAWREYAGAYDSHIEYLWNDPTFIYQIGCPIASCGSGGDQFTNALKNQAAPADYTPGFLPQGYFAGADATARAAIKQAAINYAAAEDPLDAAISAGADTRSIWRKYGAGAVTYLNNGTLTISSTATVGNTDASWIYWLPTGTADTDARLRAPSFNRWRGDQANTGGVRGGINYGSASANFSGNNKCTASFNNLLPSTVYHPTSNAGNNGVWTNQQWQRWEPYLNLTAVNGTSGAAAYPATLTASTTSNGGTATATSVANRIYNNDFLGGTITPPVAANAVPPSAHPAGTLPKVDSAPVLSNLNVVNSSGTFTGYFSSNTPGSQGQPIKTINSSVIPAGAWVSGESYSAWGDLKADLGGYVYQSTVNGFNTTTLQQSLDKIYGFTTAGTLCLANTAAVTITNAKNCAYLGNANAPGTPAYYDYRARDLKLQANAAGGTTVTRVCAWNTTGPDNTGIAVPNGGATTNDFPPPDAAGANRVWRSTANNFCVTNTTASTPALGTPGGDYSAAPACAPSSSGQAYTTVAYAGTCAWSGRQSITFEGDPATYYYGGTCGGATTCSAAGGGSCVTPHCVISAAPAIQTGTVHGQLLTNYSTTSATAGCARRSNTTTTCNTRNGGVCVTGNYAPNCTNKTAVVGASSPAPTDYATFNLAATTTNLAHECKADEGASGPWMTNQQRNFALAWAATSAAGNTNRAAPYTTTSGEQTTPGAVDMYSVNYLNWKFGPKSNGNPIGRKTRLQIAKDALVGLVNTTDGVRFGLEVFNKLPSTDPGNVGSEGGNIAYAITRMGSNSTDLPAFNNRATLNAKINALTAAAATPLTEALYEAYLYYAGRAPLFGTSATAAQGGGAVSAGRDTSVICTTAAANSGCTAIGNYKSPMLNNPDLGPAGGGGGTLLGPSVCQKNFVILITDGGPDRDISANAQIKNLQWSLGSGVIAAATNVDSTEPDTTSTWGYQFETGGLPYGPISSIDAASDGGYVWLDELAYFMAKADVSPGAPNTLAEAGVLTDAILSQRQSVITYSVGFAGGNAPVLANAALKGGGAYYVAEDSAQLSQALTDAIVAIREWNPTVASPSVPISALNRAENASDVYLSFFKPDPSQAWDGTVKRFRLGTSATECGTGITLCLTSKVVAASGFLNIERVDTLPDGTTNIVVDDTAESYWTPTPDGGFPNQGGTGYQVISNTAAPDSYRPDTRKVYTWLSNVSTSANITATANRVTEANTYTSTNVSGKISKAMLGLADTATTDTAALNAINYIRGGNGVGACADGDPSTPCVTWRTWAHGDVQHSRPAIVTYDPAPVADSEVPALQQPANRATSQYLYYLSNDGLLHAVDAATGKEKWVYLVEEALPLLTTLQTDAAGQEINIADGSPVVWVSDVNGNGAIDTATDKVYLYFGLRRGGRAYYALDVTQKDAPAMLWKISNSALCGPVGTSCSASATYSELGQSWSTPVVGSIRKLGAGVPALVIGGGYDPNQDNYKVTAADTMGRALYVVNGLDGALVRSFGNGQQTALSMDYSVPSDPAAINSDLDAQGFLDRVYVGDTGGYLWRFDINNADETTWTGKQLANLSSDTLATTDRRKILFPPAVVKQNFGVAGRFDAVYVGTGDREHPVKIQTSTPPIPDDKIFMIKDPDWDVNQPVSATTYTVADLLHLTNNSAAGITAAQLLTAGGWYRDLDSDCTPAGSPPRVSCGEKVTSAPTVFFNKLRFGTYAPTAQSNACAPAGEGRLNEIDALSGAFVTLNATSTGTSKDRYYSTFLARGYVSTGQLIVVGKNIFHITVADARLQSILVGTIGAATKIYWYMEPEL